MIPVTKPFLPEQQKYQKYVAEIFNRQWLTNNGPLVQQLEQKFREYLNIQNLLYVSNGTIALQLAIKALDLKGEIITTPFSYVATTSSIVWEGCKPVFVDIDSQTLNIDPAKIEAAITPQTSAILATHCFGNACDIEAIDAIAQKYSLKVIYDAAHCFGTKYKGKSIFDFGDISTTSLHATKLMHSTEGGIVFANDNAVLQRLSFMRNFGHNGPENFEGVGINGKNSEFHAAMGLCVLEEVRSILYHRKQLSKNYITLLKGAPIVMQRINSSCEYNYAYFPVIFQSEEITLKVKEQLELNEINPRRYFYPSLSHLNYVNKSETPISDSCSTRILCLPLFHTLNSENQRVVSRVIRKTIE